MLNFVKVIELMETTCKGVPQLENSINNSPHNKWRDTGIPGHYLAHYSYSSFSNLPLLSNGIEVSFYRPNRDKAISLFRASCQQLHSNYAYPQIELLILS